MDHDLTRRYYQLVHKAQRATGPKARAIRKEIKRLHKLLVAQENEEGRKIRIAQIKEHILAGTFQWELEAYAKKPCVHGFHGNHDAPGTSAFLDMMSPFPNDHFDGPYR